MPTIKDIVKRTGLSLGTVSKYLNGRPVKEANRQKIAAAVAELGYSYNELGRSLKTSRSGLIGVIIPSLKESFSAEIITRVEEAVQQSYGTLVCDALFSEARERDCIELFVRKRVDGVIAVPTAADGRAYARLTDAGIPLVLIDRQLDVPADVYLLDNFAAAREVAHRLCGAGHTRIGALGGPVGWQSADERIAGFTAGLADCGVYPDGQLILRGDYSVRENADRLTAELLDRAPTAVFASNYHYTLSLIAAVNRRQADLSYFGFDNLGFTDLVRPVPSLVTQPMSDYGRLAAEKLLARIAGDRSPCRTVRLPASLIDGETVKGVR